MKKAERKQIITLACIIIAGIIAGGLWGLLSAMHKPDSSYKADTGQTDAKNGTEADTGDALDSDAADSAKTTGSGDTADSAKTPDSGGAADSAKTAAQAGNEDDTKDVSGEATDDEAGEQTFSEQEKEWFMEYGGGQEVSTAELERLYKKLLSDDVWKNESRELRGLLIGDFDRNSQTDMIVMARSRNLDEWDAGGISFYFNEEPVYVYEKKGCCYGFGFWQPPCVGDIDNDGNAELILEAANGGNGGSGGRDFIYLRHTGEGWEAIDEPWNMYRNLFPADWEYDTEQWYGGYDAVGIEISTTCIGEDRYEAYCECPDERIEFDAVSSRGIEEISFGEECGGNSRGFYGFECIEYRGQNALKCREYLYGEGGISHGIGEAVFVLVWDGNSRFDLAEWWVESF